MPKIFAPLTAGLVLACTLPALAATLHPGDRISITVYNHPELAVPTTTVDSTGRVSVPIAGLVDAANATPAQVGARIADRLSPYVRKVAVDVQLVGQGQNIFVTGGPGGVLTYSPGETLTGALSQIQQGGPGGAGVAPAAGAGAVTTTSPSVVAAHDFQYGSIDLTHVVINRDGSDLPAIDAAALIASGGPGPALQPDDTIKLHDKPIAVAVRGDVAEPGVAHLDTTEPLSNAIRQVGGADETNSSVSFVLNRGGTEETVSTSSPEYSEPARPGDSIYVPRAVRIGVVGMVEKPGDVLLRGDRSVLSALYYAGGPTKYGNIKNVGVIHNGVQRQIDVTKLTHGAPGDANPLLADGDTVFVPEGHKIDFSVIFQGLLSAATLGTRL